MENTIKYWAIIENHYFGISGAAIKYTTRNICADSTAKILEELAKILFPNEEMEIYVIPAKDWCHQDSFWIKFGKVTNNSTFATIAWVLLTAYFSYPLVASQLTLNKSQEELTRIQIAQMKQTINKEVPSNKVTDEQYKQVVLNQEIKKQKNQHFQQLQKDTDIRKEQIVGKQDGKIIFDKTIESIEFPNYIEDVQVTITTKTVEKIHQLTVIKPVNDRQYKDLVWIVEDSNKKEKFGIHMADEKFYEMHLENVIWLKTLIARVKYTIDEDDEGRVFVKNKEIIVVYKYNNIERFSTPKNEPIVPAPLDFWYIKDDEYTFISKTTRSKTMLDNENQSSIFDLI